MDTPMMKCGHAANSMHTRSDGTQEPACVICDPSDGSLTIDAAPPARAEFTETIVAAWHWGQGKVADLCAWWVIRNESHP